AEQQPSAEELERQAAAQRQFEHEIQRQTELQNIQQQANQYSMALSAFIGQLNQRALKEFPDVRTLEQAENLRTSDPVRFAKLNQLLVDEQAVRGELGRIQQEHQRVQYAQAVQAQQQYERVAEAWDKQAAVLVPELADNADKGTQREIQHASLAVLKDAGLTEAQIGQMWRGGGMIHLRHPAAVKILADAAKYRLGQERVKEIREHKAPPPKLVRPGTRQPAGAADASRLKDLMQRLPSMSRSAGLDAAVQALQMKRALRNER